MVSQFSEMFEMEAFSWSLEVLYGGIGRKILIKKYFIVSTVIYWIFDHQKPGSGSGFIKNLDSDLII
jgi:hypothetical protein